MKGYIQVYTGSGKGKTTAALGLALRASGAGLKVFFAQFMKKGTFSEIRALQKHSKNITLKQYGRSGFVMAAPKPADIRAALSGLADLRSAMLSGEYDVVIADELNVAVHCGLLDIESILRLVDEKPANVELVITGRNASRRLLRRADLVTEMRCTKHYYASGTKAREGIEF